MTGMSQIQSIRSRRRNGESIASIARSERVSEPTVRKYLRVDDLSARPPVRRRRGSVIDEWLPMIEGMLAEDRETWRKQRHTATRIHERLRDEYGAGVSLSTVTRTVARQARGRGGAGGRFPGPVVASGRMPGGLRPGRRALPGRRDANAAFRVGFPVLEHRAEPADARGERGVHVPGPQEPIRMAGRGARTHRV